MGIMSFSAEPIPHVMELLEKYYKGGSVLDFGCGTGRYVDCFDRRGYLGVDGFDTNIDYCKKQWPDREFILADLETWKPPVYDRFVSGTSEEEQKFDYLFSSVSMEQLDKLPMNWAKTYILVEPIGFKHNYIDIYKPQEVIGLRGAEDVLKFMVSNV